jgi:hypothetical protein
LSTNIRLKPIRQYDKDKYLQSYDQIYSNWLSPSYFYVINCILTLYSSSGLFTERIIIVLLILRERFTKYICRKTADGYRITSMVDCLYLVFIRWFSILDYYHSIDSLLIIWTEKCLVDRRLLWRNAYQYENFFLLLILNQCFVVISLCMTHREKSLLGLFYVSINLILNHGKEWDIIKLAGLILDNWFF